MPRPHIAMRNIRHVLRLSLGEGLSLRQVAASLQMPVSTVADCLRRASAAELSWPLPEDLDDRALEAKLFVSVTPEGPEARPLPDWQRIHLELRRPHVTLMLLWHEYKETFPEGYAYSQFAEHYRRWKGHIDVVMRQEHKAGERCFVDFPGSQIPIYDPKTGGVTMQAELFVGALGASSYLYVEAVASQKLAPWVTAHVHMFEHYGGVPAILVPDNLRSAVTRPDRYEADVNATYQDMASHYRVAVIPARAYKPRDKAKAEIGVLLAERWIIARLRNRRFFSLAELNEAIAGLLQWINNRPFKKLPGSRRALYEAIDRPALRPLPAVRYELASFRKAGVNIDYHVEFRPDRHYYSVPYRLARQKVELRVTASTVEVLHEGHRVASWVRVYSPGYSTDPAHMPESHRRHGTWSPSRIIAWAKKTGPATAALAEAIMAARPHPEQGFRSCLGIMRLEKRYGSDRLEAACSRTLALRSYSYRSVQSILANGLDAKPLPGNAPARVHPRHENLRGPDYYQ